MRNGERKVSGEMNYISHKISSRRDNTSRHEDCVPLPEINYHLLNYKLLVLTEAPTSDETSTNHIYVPLFLSFYLSFPLYL